MNYQPEGASLLNFNEQDFLLLKEKALYDPQKKALLIADLHFGKAAHFRKAGIPVPEKPHQDDLIKLEKLIKASHSKAVIILGDLFHSTLNKQWAELERFFGDFPEVEFHLVKGNHDILPPVCYQAKNLKVHQAPHVFGMLMLSHHPMEKPPMGYLNVCGHIHPGFSFRSTGRQWLRLPCFYKKHNLLILPAFGKFTGLFAMDRTKEDEIFVVTDKKVIPINLIQ